jgi:hypothetical protein
VLSSFLTLSIILAFFNPFVSATFGGFVDVVPSERLNQTELKVQESINRTKNIFNESGKHKNKFLRTYPNIFFMKNNTI